MIESIDFSLKSKKYAEILIKVGVDLKPGQPLCIDAPVEHAAFVTELTHQAYLAGASSVGVIWQSDQLTKVHLDHLDHFDTTCEQTVAQYYSSIGAAYILLLSPNIHVFSESDPKRVNAYGLATSKIRKILQSRNQNFGHTIACLPNQEWANLIFPELPPEARLNALWEAVFSCVRVNCANPVDSWAKYLQDTNELKQFLTEKNYVRYHYTAKGTDFQLDPAPVHQWMGGCMEAGNKKFVPNLPTEELFTTPDKYSANGFLTATLPLNYRGQIIEEMRLWFVNGKVVNFEAKKGKDLLEQLLKTDAGACYLGEMALVPQTSTVAQFGRIFYTTLFDENASCHLALGNAYGSEDKIFRRDNHYNSSEIHVDFMIGSDDLCVRGQLPDGTWEEILVNGCWAQ